MSSQQPTGQSSPAMSAQTHPGASPSPAKRGVCLLVHARDGRPPEKLVASLVRHGASIVSCVDAHTALAHACRINRGLPVHAAPEPGAAPASRAVVVILVEPLTLSDRAHLAELAGALKRYAPRSTLWYFEDGENKQPLRVVTSDDLARWCKVEGAPTGETDSTRGMVTPSVFVPPVRTPIRNAGAPNGQPGASGPRLRLVDPDGSAAGAQASGSVAQAPTPAPAPAPAPVHDAPRIQPSSAFDFTEVTPQPAPHLLTAEELSMLLGDPEGFDLADPPSGPDESSKPPAGGSPAA